LEDEFCHTDASKQKNKIKKNSSFFLFVDFFCYFSIFPRRFPKIQINGDKRCVDIVLLLPKSLIPRVPHAYNNTHAHAIAHILFFLQFALLSLSVLSAKFCSPDGTGGCITKFTSDSEEVLLPRKRLTHNSILP